jgi:hypothetical protein
MLRPRASRLSFASLASIASIAGLFAIAACSAPGDPSAFSKGNKAGSGADSPGTFGTGEDENTEAKGECVTDKGAYDIPGDGCDNDGDGKVDNPPACDSALANDGSPEEFARTMGICDLASKRGFGLVSAKFTRGYGREDAPMPQQHGVLDKFGNVLKPREGARLGVLSTGFAQEYDGAQGALFGGDAQGKDWFGAGIGGGAGNGTAPPGYPKAAGACPIATNVNDVIDLRLTLKAPKNATGIKFDFNFHSGEWPAYICSRFNDGFVAYLSAAGFNGGQPDNISFDAKKNPVSVNNGFFDRCTPGARIGCEQGATPGTSVCPGGTAELAGTGFGVVGNYCPGGGGQSVSGGATGWLSSSAPVKAGETFTLDLMIWDTGDGDLDSSVLLDNFQWIGGANVVTSTGRPQGPN